MSLRPPKSGAMSGCWIDTVPSSARPSPQASSSCAHGQVPGAMLARLVEMGREVDPRRHLGELLGELHVGRSVEDWVAAEDEEDVDLVLVDVVDERLEVRAEIRGLRDVGDGGVARRVADVLERGVQRMDERVDVRRLPTTCEDGGLALVRGELLGCRHQESLGTRGWFGVGDGVLDRAEIDVVLRDLCGEGARERIELARREAQPLVRVRARHRERRLDHIEAAHRVRRAIELAPMHEALRRVKRALLSVEEVRVERHDGLCERQVVAWNDRLAKRDAGSLARVALGDRRKRVHACVGELVARERLQPKERRRARRPDEHANTRSTVGLRRLQDGGEGLVEGRPVALFALLAHGRRAVGVVEVRSSPLASRGPRSRGSSGAPRCPRPSSADLRGSR